MFEPIEQVCHLENYDVILKWQLSSGKYSVAIYDRQHRNEIEQVGFVSHIFPKYFQIFDASDMEEAKQIALVFVEEYIANS